MAFRASVKKLRRALRGRQRRLEARLKKRMLGENVAAIIVPSANGIFAVDIEDDGVGRALRLRQSYGEDEIRRAAAYLDASADVLVVGAHIGAVAIPLARQCRRLWAIEANPKTFDLLATNIRLNKADNIEALPLAAGDKEEEIEFVMSRANSGGSKRMPKIRAGMYFDDNPEIVTVTARPLDELFAGRKFALVFMDIEGSEYFALKGMQKILGDAKTLVVEFLPHHLRNVAAVTPEDFLAPIAPHFAHMSVPSQGLSVGRAEFAPVLRAMYDRDQGDAGLIFTQ